MDPHEVLGVARDAGPEQITAAYRAQAARFHPDRHADASPAEREQLQRRMAAVNEAYAALRHVERRLPPPPPPPPPPPRPVATAPLTPADPPTSRRSGRGCVVALAVVAVLLMVTVVAAVVSAGGDDGTSPAPWAVGSCVEGGDQLDAVRCDGAHDGRIVGVGDGPEDCPGPTDGVVAVRGYIWCIDRDR